MAGLPRNVALVEFGSGSAQKTRLVLEAILRHQPSLNYAAIDVSRTALEESSLALLFDYLPLRATLVIGTYEDGLAALPTVLSGPKLFLWLGSNIGNLHRDEAIAFLRKIRSIASPTDRLLIGVDLRKDRATLERAYNDARLATARFNKNLLSRINRELDGNFDLQAFQHRAHYDPILGRIEMHLVSLRAQEVFIRDLDIKFQFREGETIHTENSYKYGKDEIDALGRSSGWILCGRWHDREHRFATLSFCAEDHRHGSA